MSAILVQAETQKGLELPQLKHQIGDYIIVFWSQRYGTVTTPLGWTHINTPAVLNAHRAVIFYKKALTNNEVIVSGENTAGSSQVSTVMIIRNATAISADFIDAIATKGDNGVAYATPEIIPNFDRELTLMFDFGGVAGRQLAPYQGVIEESRNVNGSNFQGVCSTYSKAALTPISPHPYTLCGAATYKHFFVVICIKSDGNNNLEGYTDYNSAPATLLHALAPLGSTGHLQGARITFDPTAQVPSITNLETTYSDITQYDAIDSGDSLITGVNGSSIENASVTSNVLIAGSDFNVTKDLSNSVLSLTHRGAGRTSTAKIAKMIGLTDGTNSEFWQIGANNLKPDANKYEIVTSFQLSANLSKAKVGVLNKASVTSLLLAAEVNSGSVGQVTYGFLYELNTMSLLGGDNVNPIDYSLAYKISRTSALNTVQSQLGQSDKQFYVSQSVSIGNGVDEVNFDGSGQSVVFPSKTAQHKVSEGAFTQYIKGILTGKISLRDMVFFMGDYHKFNIVAGGDIDLNNCSVSNATPILNDVGVAVKGFILSNSKEVTYTSLLDMSGGCSFSKCVDSQQFTITNQVDFEKLKNCHFDSNSNLSILITGNHGGQTWSASGMTIANGQGTYDIEYTGTGTLTISADNGSGITQLRSNATVGTLTISSPVTAYTLTSDQPSTLLEIFATGTQTLLASTTGTTLTHEFSGTVVVDIVATKAGFLPIRSTGVTLSNSTNSLTLSTDPVYISTHGLTYTTDLSYDSATKVLTITTPQEARNIYSAMIDAYIAQAALRNKPFDFKAIGLDRIDLLSGMTLADTSKWRGAGMEWQNSSDVITHKFYSIKGVGANPAGTIGYYQQIDGSGTTALTLVNNNVDQVIQYYSDPNGDSNLVDGYNYSTHLVIKLFKNGYYQARSDVMSAYNLTNIESYEYTVPLLLESTGLAVGNPAITLSITDHTATPLVVGGKSFDYEVVDVDGSSAELMLRKLSYDTCLDPTATIYGSYTAFNLPDIIINSGGTYETQYGYLEGNPIGLHGFYVSRASLDHPDLVRHQSNDGTYYVKPVTANASITNLSDDVGGLTRLQIKNITTDTIIYDADPNGTSYSASYTDGIGYSGGDLIRIRFAHINGAISFESGETFTTASTSGFSVDMAFVITSDVNYATDAVDGGSPAILAKFSPDFVNLEVDFILAADFYSWEAYAFFCYTLTLSNGIELFWGGVEASSSGYLIKSAILNLWFNNNANSSFRQLDPRRIYRDVGDGYPVRDPTTSGYGIDVQWQLPVSVVEVNTGSAVNQATVQAALDAQGYTANRATNIDNVAELHQTLGLDKNNPKTNKPDGGFTVGAIEVVGAKSGNDIVQTRL